MVSRPYDDDTPEGAVILPQGSIDFLKMTLRSKEGGPVVAPDDDWLDWDGGADTTTVVTIRDPDGNKVGSTWKTVQLDDDGFPNGDDDTYDDTHDDYVGDPDGDGTDEHLGLFQKDKSTGHIAQKVKVPNDAEKTTGDNDRFYEIVWEIRRNDSIIGGGVTEAFNVADAGVVSFESGLAGIVDVNDVLLRVDTNLTDSKVKDILAQAIDEVEGYLLNYYIDPDTLNSQELISLKFPIIDLAILYVRQHDGTANEVVSNLREGSLALGFAGNSNINFREAHAQLFREDDENPGKLYQFVRSRSPAFKPDMTKATRKSARNVRRRSMRGPGHK